MGTRLRLFVILLGAVVVLATYTYPLWRPGLAANTLVEDDFPELTAEQQAGFQMLPPFVQRGYLLMRQHNALMAAELVAARLQSRDPLPPEEQEPPAIEGAQMVYRLMWSRPSSPYPVVK